MKKRLFIRQKKKRQKSSYFSWFCLQTIL